MPLRSVRMPYSECEGTRYLIIFFVRLRTQLSSTGAVRTMLGDDGLLDLVRQPQCDHPPGFFVGFHDWG